MRTQDLPLWQVPQPLPPRDRERFDEAFTDAFAHGRPSRPRPACYGAGGIELTITDAEL